MFFKFRQRYHSAAAMRSAYNTGSVSGTGGVSDCAGLQSIGAAITSAATGDYLFKFWSLMKCIILNDKETERTKWYDLTIFIARNSQDHLNHRSAAASVAASAAAASMFGPGMGLNCK